MPKRAYERMAIVDALFAGIDDHIDQNSFSTTLELN